MTPSVPISRDNARLIAELGVGGRLADGTLVLVAPPGWSGSAEALLPVIRRALIAAGDAHGGNVVIQHARR